MPKCSKSGSKNSDFGHSFQFLALKVGQLSLRRAKLVLIWDAHCTVNDRNSNWFEFRKYGLRLDFGTVLVPSVRNLNALA